MNIKINSNFPFSVTAIQIARDGSLSISISSDNADTSKEYQYAACLGDGPAEERRPVSLAQYALDFAEHSNIKQKTKSSYYLMIKHLERYGDITLDKITTAYLQGFISHLQNRGLKPGTVHLNFQKLACVLHDAYKNELFDDRVLQRVKRPQTERGKKCFLTEAELKRLGKHPLDEKYSNIQNMFLFSIFTGLRFGDILGLRWTDVKRSGKHLRIEFRQHKTSTVESLPLCGGAEAIAA